MKCPSIFRCTVINTGAILALTMGSALAPGMAASLPARPSSSWAIMANASETGENCETEIRDAKGTIMQKAHLTAYSSMRHALLVHVAENDVHGATTLLNHWRTRESPLDIQEALQAGLATAAFFGEPAMVRQLITQGAKPDLWTNRTNRNTAIAIAAACGHLDVIKTILANGGSISARGAVYGAIGQTTAFAAAVDGLHPTVAIWVVKHGFDVCKEVDPAKLSMMRRLVASRHLSDELGAMLACPPSSSAQTTRKLQNKNR